MQTLASMIQSWDLKLQQTFVREQCEIKWRQSSLSDIDFQLIQNHSEINGQRDELHHGPMAPKSHMSEYSNE